VEVASEYMRCTTSKECPSGVQGSDQPMGNAWPQPTVDAVGEKEKVREPPDKRALLKMDILDHIAVPNYSTT
jgi:hypothetical protein